MQHLENDMDDIFHKAGHEYPLNTSSSNWEQVRTALYDEGALAPAKKNYRKFLWLLLLLIPFAWIKYNQHSSAPSISQNKTGNAGVQASNSTAEKISDQTVAVNENNKDKKVSAASVDNNKTASSLSSKRSSEKVASVIKPAGTVIKQSASTQSQTTTKQAAGSVNKTNPAKAIQLSASNKKDHPSEPQLSGSAQEVSSLNTLKSSASKMSKNNSPLLKNSTINNGVATANELKYFNAKNQPASLVDAYSLNNIKKPVVPANPNPEITVSTNDKKKTTTKKQSKLYIGLIVGPDLSYVKSQKVKNIGYSVGLNIGYRLNKHFALEVGAMYDQKKYFTKGEYFDKTGAGVPDYVTLAWLNGGCNMFEFPLLARYNFNIRNSSFFVSGGLTSYIMSKESYQYSAEANGSWYEGYKSYNHSGNHLFSNMQWSLGYNLKLSPSTQIRIEPYLKIPVKNIGIGKMPVTSSGLYLGITRDLK